MISLGNHLLTGVAMYYLADWRSASEHIMIGCLKCESRHHAVNDMCFAAGRSLAGQEQVIRQNFRKLNHPEQVSRPGTEHGLIWRKFPVLQTNTIHHYHHRLCRAQAMAALLKQVMKRGCLQEGFRS